MQVIADLHVHSRHSRATSINLSIENLEKFGKIKGLDLIGTGDFQHPLYRKEIDEKLEEDDKGILRTKPSSKIGFLWQTEISLMYSQGGKKRAVHIVMLAPNRITADKIIEYLGNKGRLDYDGRPIFGMTCQQLVKDLKEIDDKIEIIPAHCMTPWFGLFGSKSGFDSLEECFGEQVKHIYAVESGISADPAMLWRIKENVTIVRFSDAHSFCPWRIGREATIFDMPELRYDNIIKAIRTGKGLKATIETPPAYGKYHWDGHRNCGFSCSPQKTKELSGICPVCNKSLTIGVDYRVEEVAKEPQGYKPQNVKPFYLLLPLHELLALCFNTSLSSKKAWQIYNELIEKFDNEFNILLDITKEQMLGKDVDQKLWNLILKNRDGKIKVKPGFDGEYGKLILEERGKQSTLF